MTVKTAAGTRIFIGPAVTEAAADTLAEMQNLSPYTEIGEVESLGEFGDESPLSTFADLGAARIRQLKAARAAGVCPLVVGHDPLDAGQLALIAAEATPYEFAIKVIMSDAPTGAYDPSEQYFRALVSSKRLNIGANDNVVRRTFNLAINSEIFEDVSAPS